jgi:predicted DNA-binding transcriptional regulator YafY
MNRTDRLVALVMMMQSRRVTTAAEMARHFEITERTVYRDIAALGESGVPIVGEPGVGYSLMRGYHLPPVMFSPDEAFALITGGLLTERMTDGSMHDAIRSALGKVTAVLPPNLQGRVDRLSRKIVVKGRSPTQGAVPLSTVQMALAEGRMLRLHYRGAMPAEPTERIVEPLGLVFYLDHWHLFAWCRLRDDVRDFRVDRIMGCESRPDPITPRPHFNLQEHLAKCMTPDPGHITEIELPAYALESARRFWGPTILDEQTCGPNVRVRFGFEPDGMDYVAGWLLGQGTGVRIIEPAALREKVTALALAAAQHHQAEISPPAKMLLT